MDSYVIADDSPVPRVTVDDKKLVLGGDPVGLTKDQVKRVEELGAKLSGKAASSGNTENQS